DALPDLIDVTDVEADEFRTPECSRETDQQQRLVPPVLRSVAHSLQHGEQIIFEDWLGFTLGCAEFAPDPAQSGFDDFGLGRVAQSSRSMGLRKCSKSPRDRRWNMSVREVRDVVGNPLWRG